VIQEQLDFFSPIEVVHGIPGETLQQRFERFHARNPHVLAALVSIARRMVKAGRKRIGIKQLYEVLRYERLIYTNSDDGHRLNNSFTSRYARLIIAQEPDLAEAFETRVLRAA
jgi:hypothetical protein